MASTSLVCPQEGVVDMTFRRCLVASAVVSTSLVSPSEGISSTLSRRRHNRSPPSSGGASDASPLPIVPHSPQVANARELNLPLVVRGTLPSQHPANAGQLMLRQPRFPLVGRTASESNQSTCNLSATSGQLRSSPRVPVENCMPSNSLCRIRVML